MAEWQQLINTAVGVMGLVLIIAGWLLKSIWDANSEIRASIARMQADQLVFERQINADFARRDDVREMFNQLLSAVTRIESKLDQKADK